MSEAEHSSQPENNTPNRKRLWRIAASATVALALFGGSRLVCEGDVVRQPTKAPLPEAPIQVTSPAPIVSAEHDIWPTPTPGPYDLSRGDIEDDPRVEPGGNQAVPPPGSADYIPDDLRQIIGNDW